jgi:hypothetical protein
LAALAAHGLLALRLTGLILLVLLTSGLLARLAFRFTELFFVPFFSHGATPYIAPAWL